MQPIPTLGRSGIARSASHAFIPRTSNQWAMRQISRAMATTTSPLQKGLISSATGGLEISGVKSEQSVGVAEYGYQGILGPNEYSIGQLNTNDKTSTSAWGCSGHRGCKVWQQFLYSTDYVSGGVAEVYMQYWLLNYGSCPSGWNQSGTSNCYVNSPLADAPDIPVKELGVDLAASAQAGGNDCVTLYFGSEVVSNCFRDSMLHISSVWNKGRVQCGG